MLMNKKIIIPGVIVLIVAIIVIANVMGGETKFLLNGMLFLRRVKI